MGFKSGLGQVMLMLCAVGMASSCGNSRRAAKNRVTLNEVTVSAKNNPNNIYREATAKVWEIEHTRVALSFNYKAKTADGRVWLKMHPYFYDTDTLRLDMKSMRIDSMIVSINGKVEINGTGRSLGDNIIAEKATIRLKTRVKATDNVEVYLKYTAMPYESKSGGSEAINDDKGLYFINTNNEIPGKPVQIWTQGETESNSHWVPTIDKPNQRTTVQVELTVSDTLTTLSNGYLSKQIPQGNGMRTDIWIMDKPIQVYAIMFAIGKFAVVKDKEWQGKEISYYVEPDYAPYAKDMFRHTPEMVDFFSKCTGIPYPWNKYSQVVVRDYVSGAMENTSATLFGEFQNQNTREYNDENHEDVVSHELFHQWFGDYVTAESWSNLTLSESFATFGEQLWRMHKYGKASADELCWKDLNIYIGSQAISPLVRFHYADKEDMFDRISYQKGAAILHYLHGLMGDEAFSKSMQLYLSKNALHAAEATQWRLAIEEATGQDWNWFFDQWYLKGGHPQLDIKYTYDAAAQKLSVAITQKQDGAYHLPLKTKIVFGQQDTTVDWDIIDKNTKYVYSYKNGQRPLIIPDVKHWLVGELTEDKTSADWLLTFRNSGDDIVDRFRSLRSIKKKWDDTANVAIVTLALQDKEPSVKRMALELLTSVTISKLKEKWTRDVIYLANNDGNNKVRASAFDLLGSWNVTSAKDDMFAALGDSSYAVAGAALQALGVVAKDTVYSIAKKMMLNDPRSDLDAAIWDVIGDKAVEADIALFEERAPYYYGNKKIDLAASLSQYLQNTTSNASFNKGLATYQNMVKAEVISSYRVAIASYLVSTALYYKNLKKTARTNPDQTQADNRLALIKPVLDKIVADETDEAGKKTMSNYVKAVYGN